jgi:DNA-binding NarL/FixJ family response regulator
MKVVLGKVGILGPVYPLAGQGLSNREIATKLHITEIKVADCVGWILQFLQFKDRLQLAQYASSRTTGAGAELGV